MPSWYERAAECRRHADEALQAGSEVRALEAVARLEEMAGDDDASVREVSLRALARLAALARQAVLEVLMVAVDDPVESVRAEAFRALGAAAERGCELAVPLAKHEAGSIESAPKAVRIEAIRALQRVAQVGDWSTIGQLAQHAQEDDAAIRRVAVEALSELAPPAPGQARVIAFLAGRGRDEAVSVLPPCPDEEAAACLQPCQSGHGSCRDPDWQVRTAALKALVRVAPRECPRACDAAEEAARDPRLEVRSAAADALRDLAPIGDLGAARVLAELCQDSSSLVRKAALGALQVLEKCEDGSSPHETAVRACLECWERSLADADKSVRVLALETAVALLGYNAEEVVRGVARGLEANSPEQRAAAVEGLTAVVDRPSALLVAQVVRRVIDDRGPVRKDASLALSKLLPGGHALAVEELVGHVDKPDAGVRKAVLEALQRCARRGDEAAAKAISTRLWDPEATVRCAALRALAEVAAPEDSECITRACLCLEDDDKTVRETVAEALPKLAGPRNRTAIQCLAHCIRNTMKYPKRENTREAACLAMSKWAERGSEEAVYVICGTICQDYPQATVAALRALPLVAQCGDRAALDGAASALIHKEQRTRDLAIEVLEQLANRGSRAPASASLATGFEGRWTGGRIKGRKIIWGDGDGAGDVITHFELRPGPVLTTVCSDKKGRQFPAWARLDAYGCLRWDFGAEWRRVLDPQENGLAATLRGGRLPEEHSQVESSQLALQDELGARAAALERQIFGDDLPKTSPVQQQGIRPEDPQSRTEEVGPQEEASQEQQEVEDIGDVYATAAVAAHFKNTDPTARQAAVSALPRVVGKGSQAALDALLPMMTDSATSVRLAAVDSLAAVAERGDPRAVDALRVRLEDQERVKDAETGEPKGSSVGMSAAKALKKLVTSKSELAQIVGALNFNGPSLRGF